MKKFIENAGATIFVSHSSDQIRQVCNTVMVLRNGKISFIGDVEEGLDHYMKQSPGPS
jgi:ABC-type polysaccharide/polyol phosphate transport system ATPase subunit